MYDTKIAAKLLAQLNGFLGRISPHFRKPVARFIGDMMYGIMAEKDVKLSSIVRALKEGITPQKVEDRRCERDTERTWRKMAGFRPV